MVGTAVFFYGLMVSFIFSGASRNARLRRANPPALRNTGYVLCGLSAGASLILLAHVLGDAVGVPLLTLIS